MENSLNEFLSRVSFRDVVDRINAFRTIDYRTISDEDLIINLYNTFSPISEDNLSFSLAVNIAVYPTGTKFFRARKATNTFTPVDCAVIEQDAWCAPAHVVKQGRINRDNEPILYTSPVNLNVALNEIACTQSDIIAAFIYTAVKPVKVCVIGSRLTIPDLTSENQIKHDMLTDFLRVEFTRHAGSEYRYLYRLSEMIAKHLYDFPPSDVQDGWCYPSVAFPSAFNVAFRESCAHDCLELNGAMIGRSNKTDTQCFNVLMVAKPQNGNFIYHHIGSDYQKEHFPDIESPNL